ncbi:MAG TPA: DUF5063 domain-containing protein [Polyangiaceae bacterium]|nr:DUF5063 domain-containing protein [Polyangiaceae bacterium]
MRPPGYSHPALTEFAAIAGAFCAAVANGVSRKPAEQLDQIHRILPRVYSAALQLPDVSTVFANDDERELEAAQPVVVPPGLAQLAEFLGERRFYREVYDPYAEPTEGECTGDLIDDLGDIYQDLRGGLVHWENGEPREALWAWRFNFQIHWAEHATSALRALFALSAWRDVPWPSGTR